MIPQTNSFIRDKLRLVNEFGEQSRNWYYSQSALKKVLIQLLVGLGAIAVILVVIFHNYIIKELIKLSDSWKDLKYGSVLLFTLIFIVGFPPLVGFSVLSMLSGMIYGFEFGWTLLATATITGSFSSFLVFRYVLRDQAVKLINHNEKFRAFSEILREDSSLFLLILIRLCPLPYSLSNGGLAAIPELSARTFLLASVVTSPKLMIHVFVGKKIKELGDATKPKSTKLLDVISIIITGFAAFLVTYIIYNKMQKKLQSYHAENGVVHNDRMIFGNFEDDLESGTNVELNSADFDADNFVIDDDLNDEESNSQSNRESSPKLKESVKDFDIDDELNVGKMKNSSVNRDY